MLCQPSIFGSLPSFSNELERRGEGEALARCRDAYASYIVNSYDYDISDDIEDEEDWAMRNTRLSSYEYLELVCDRPIDINNQVDRLVRQYATVMGLASLAYMGGMKWMHYDVDRSVVFRSGLDENTILNVLNHKLHTIGIERSFRTIDEALVAKNTFTGKVIHKLAQEGGDIEVIADLLRAKGIGLERDGIEPIDVEDLRWSLK